MNASNPDLKISFLCSSSRTMKCAVAPRNDTRFGVDHASAVSDTRPKDFYEMLRDQCDRMTAHQVYFTCLHFPVEFFPFFSPCFHDALCKVRPFGDLVIGNGNVVLAEVQEKVAKVRVINYID